MRRLLRSDPGNLHMEQLWGCWSTARTTPILWGGIDSRYLLCRDIHALSAQAREDEAKLGRWLGSFRGLAVASFGALWTWTRSSGTWRFGITATDCSLFLRVAMFTRHLLPHRNKSRARISVLRKLPHLSLRFARWRPAKRISCLTGKGSSKSHIGLPVLETVNKLEEEQGSYHHSSEIERLWIGQV